MNVIADPDVRTPRPRRVMRRSLASLLLVALGVVVLVPVLTAARVWWVARQDGAVPSDAIVVLGASQYDGRPSEVFEARLQHALDLYQDDVAPVVVTLGGKLPGDRFTEAAAGRDWLVDAGVPADDVVAVEAGATTSESLSAAAPVFDELGVDSVVLVSDPWHAFRSTVMAQDLGVEAVASPTRTGPVVQTRETQVRYIVRETAAFLWYRVMGADAAPPEAGADDAAPGTDATPLARVG